MLITEKGISETESNDKEGGEGERERSTWEDDQSINQSINKGHEYEVDNVRKNRKNRAIAHHSTDES